MIGVTWMSTASGIDARSMKRRVRHHGAADSASTSADEEAEDASHTVVPRVADVEARVAGDVPQDVRRRRQHELLDVEHRDEDLPQRAGTRPRRSPARNAGTPCGPAIVGRQRVVDVDAEHADRIVAGWLAGSTSGSRATLMRAWLSRRSARRTRTCSWNSGHPPSPGSRGRPRRDRLDGRRSGPAGPPSRRRGRTGSPPR